MSIPEIIAAAATHYGLEPKAIRGAVRNPLKQRARNFSFRLLKATAGLDINSIAEATGCHRRTVSTALRIRIGAIQEKFEQPAWHAVLQRVQNYQKNTLTP